jgi:hypothetical protein
MVSPQTRCLGGGKLMQGMVHPFSGALYERCESDPSLVRVSLDDRWGLFRSNGAWVSGEIYSADPHLCGWIAGPKLVHHRLEA